MSAFQVSDKCLKMIAAWSVDDRASLSEINDILIKLWDANSHSLFARYGEPSQGTAPQMNAGELRLLRQVDAVVVLKQCHCYAYQSCEYEGWESSKARSHMQDAEQHAITALPGYEDAPWDMC